MENEKDKINEAKGKDAALNLSDKFGNTLFDNCIVLGALSQTGIESPLHWNLGWSSQCDGTIEMISCEYGYIHNVDQETIKEFELIGSVDDFKHLLECD